MLPGISVRLTPGHVPFLQTLIVSDRGETAAFMSDLIPTTAHLPLPWIMGYDLEPLRTLESKRTFLRDAVAGGWRLIFEHDPGVASGWPVSDGSEVDAPRRRRGACRRVGACRTSTLTHAGAPTSFPPRKWGAVLLHPPPAGPVPQRYRVPASQREAATGCRGNRRDGHPAVSEGCPFCFLRLGGSRTVHKRSRKANSRQPDDPDQSRPGHHRRR